MIFSPLKNEDDVSAPALQRGLSKEDLKIKEKIVFDRAMNSLSEYYWKDFKYDGLTVNIQPILVGEDNLLFTDFDYVLACLKSLMQDLHKYSDLLLEFKQIHGHINRHLNRVWKQIVLRWVQIKSCQRDTRSREETLPLPSPSLNRNLTGNYNNEVFNEEKVLMMKINPQQWNKILAGATFVQIFLSNQLLNEQDIKACSIADKKKVWKNDKEWKFHCPFVGCQSSFASQPSLSQHQTAKRHRARDSPVQLQKISSKCKSHQTISDMLGQVKTVFTLI